MKDRYGLYTSIIYDGKSNLQLNWEGFGQQPINEFAQSCANRGAVWGRLMRQKDGNIAATYDKDLGLQIGSEERDTEAAPAAVETIDSADIALRLSEALRKIAFTPAQQAIIASHFSDLTGTPAARQSGPGGMN